MDLELKHLGQTVAIGGVAVYALQMLLRSCRRWRAPRYPEGRGRTSQVLHAAVALAMIFGVGIVVEDVGAQIAKTMVGLVDRWPEARWSLGRSVFMEEFGRTESLFTVKLERGRWWLQASPLARELKTLDSEDSPVQTEYRLFRGICQRPGKKRGIPVTTEEMKQLTAAVNAIFFDAKNEVFRKPTYYEELAEIDDRIEFTRALTVLSTSLFLLYLAFLIAVWLTPLGRVTGCIPHDRKRLLFGAAIFLAAAPLAALACDHEQQEFNRRVYGYHISLAARNGE